MTISGSLNSGRLKLLPPALCALAIAGWIGLLVHTHGDLYYDDAFMFYRYALHLRHGLGLSWNMDGIHTYGMTSLLWQAVIVVFSYLPVEHGTALLLASWLSAGLAVAATTAAVCVLAKSALLRSPWITMPMVMLPLLAASPFRENVITGMETMLAAALLAATVGLAIAQSRDQVRPEWTGLVAALAYLTRPESAMPVVLMLVLMTNLSDRKSVRSTVRALAVLFVVIVVSLVCSKLYFHTWTPLSFYVKSRHGYLGYATRWMPVNLALLFLRSFAIFVFGLVLFSRRSDRRLLVATLVPLAAVMLYLCTVTQIMGMEARYYFPYFPFCVIPALLVFDSRLQDRTVSGAELVSLPRVGLLFVATWFIFLLPSSVPVLMERMAERSVLRFSDVVYQKPARGRLPELPYWTSMKAVAGPISSAMAAGGIVAASEVGYLGNAAQDKNVIDMEGLNDTDIALQGFNPDRLLDRHPDVIWMPHMDYTYQRAVLMTNPRLLREYDFYADAFAYGLAIRKDSPFHDALTARVESIWPEFYPGTRPADYLVTGTAWDGKSTVVPVMRNP